MSLYLETVKEKGVNLPYQEFKKETESFIDCLIHQRKQEISMDINPQKQNFEEVNIKSKEKLIPEKLSLTSNLKLLKTFEKPKNKNEEYEKMLNKLIE